MGKLSISFETTTEDRNEMNAIRDFVLAISNSGTMSGSTVPQQLEKKEHIKANLDATVETLQKIKNVTSPQTVTDTEKIDDNQSVDTETHQDETEEEKAARIKEEKNAARRERDRATKARKAAEEAAAKEAAANKEADPTENAPNVSAAVAQDAANEAQPEPEPVQVTTAEPTIVQPDEAAMKNECRTLMSEKANNGHRETIKKELDRMGVKGLGGLSVDQFKEILTFLKSL